MLIGYMITAAVLISLILMLVSAYFERKGLMQLLREHVDRYSLLALVLILVFFFVFALKYVSAVEQLYFDENIYEGIALNILNHGNALWCQFGTGYVKSCYINSLYHDPVGWSVFIAIAFAILGVGPATAYHLELMAGAFAIVFVFLLASLLFKRRSYAVISTFAFSLMPQLFVWSRTQADVDLAFVMLSALAFFLFVVFSKRKTLGTLALFSFSLVLVSYMRIEAILLVPIFAVLLFTFGEKGIWETMQERVKEFGYVVVNDTKALLLLLAFVLLMLPEVYYIALQAQSPSYGQGATQAAVGLENFQKNIDQNLKFVFGQLNQVSEYPAVFHYTIVPLAILGVFMLAIDWRKKNRFSILIMLLLWFLAYFLFYTSFYAGSATYGVDSRFMLQLLPASCLLAAFIILGVGDAAYWLVSKKVNAGKNISLTVYLAAIAILAGVLLVYPFALVAHIVTLQPTSMPQQSTILKAINTFYNEYSDVPNNCLVFSFTTDIWEEFNRSSIQIGYINGANSTTKGQMLQYSCKVFDYGYWCVVPPYHGTTCSNIQDTYRLQNLTTPGEPPGGYNVTFYRILNYS